MWKELTYSEQIKYVAEKNRVREPEDIDHTNDIIVGDTPKYLLNLGYRQLPMLYTKRHLLSALNKKEFLTGRNHEISLDTMNRIPKAISNPVAVFESHNGGNRYEILTNLLDKNGAPILIAVTKNGYGWVDNKRIQSNFVLSIFGKDREFGRYMDRVYNENRMVFYDKKKLIDLMKVSSVTKPSFYMEDERIIDYEYVNR